MLGETQLHKDSAQCFYRTLILKIPTEYNHGTEYREIFCLIAQYFVCVLYTHTKTLRLNAHKEV